MNLAFSLAIGVLVSAAAFLMLERDLIRVVIGTVLLSNAANLFIVASGMARGKAPILPLPEHGAISDPLAQAMVVTAVVINFAVTALLIFLVLRVFETHHLLSMEEIAEIEASDGSERVE